MKTLYTRWPQLRGNKIQGVIKHLQVSFPHPLPRYFTTTRWTYLASLQSWKFWKTEIRRLLRFSSISPPSFVTSDKPLTENIDFKAPLGKSDNCVILIQCKINPLATSHRKSEHLPRETTLVCDSVCNQFYGKTYFQFILKLSN